MSKNPFLVLGINENATQAEVESAYTRLRNKFRLDMHQEGERGKIAAKNLSEVEVAYHEINDILQSKVSYDGNVYSSIEQLVKSGRYDEAQNALDNVSERGAEWHYYQSAIFYKKGWLMEARSQLRLAVSMEPKNEKYVNALNKLEDKLNNRTQGAHNTNSAGAGANAQSGYQRSYQNQAHRDESADTCCACCQGLICANCLCDCMRCC